MGATTCSLDQVLDSLLYTPRNKSLARHIILTLLLVAGTLAIGMTTNDLGVVLAFNVRCDLLSPLSELKSHFRCILSLLLSSASSLPSPPLTPSPSPGLFHCHPSGIYPPNSQLPEALQAREVVFKREGHCFPCVDIWGHCHVHRHQSRRCAGELWTISGKMYRPMMPYSWWVWLSVPSASDSHTHLRGKWTYS